MTAFTPVDPANPQRETIYTQLKNAIINGDIAPDERIVETKYADIFPRQPHPRARSHPYAGA